MNKKKEELLKRLEHLAKLSQGDAEAAHGEADDAIIAYIDDKSIEDAYGEIKKWYS